MKVKTLIVSIIIIMIFSSAGALYAFAASSQDKLDSVQRRASDVKDDLSDVERDLLAQQKEVDSINSKIKTTESAIKETEINVKKTKAEMKERKDGLDDRLRAMYKNGSVGYLDVLLGSTSISELISNLEMIKKIYANDQKVLTTLKEEKLELEKKELKLEKNKESLKTLQASATSKSEKLTKEKNELKKQYDDLQAEADALKEEIYSKQDNDAVYEGGVFTWPSPGYHQITSSFGFRYHPIFGDWRGHTGVDIGVPYGKTVVAAASGKVIMSQVYGGYGYAIVIDHGSGISTLYGHNSRLLVSVGQRVSKGQTIAKSGSSGWSTGPHLHFEVRIKGSYVNPMKYF